MNITQLRISCWCFSQLYDPKRLNIYQAELASKVDRYGPNMKWSKMFLYSTNRECARARWKETSYQKGRHVKVAFPHFGGTIKKNKKFNNATKSRQLLIYTLKKEKERFWKSVKQGALCLPQEIGFPCRRDSSDDQRWYRDGRHHSPDLHCYS